MNMTNSVETAAYFLNNTRVFLCMSLNEIIFFCLNRCSNWKNEFTFSLCECSVFLTLSKDIYVHFNIDWFFYLSWNYTKSIQWISLNWDLANWLLLFFWWLHLLLCLKNRNFSCRAAEWTYFSVYVIPW